MKKLLFLFLIPLLSIGQETECPENSFSVLTNPSFSTGSSESCWESNGEITILENEYDDNFSAQVVGNYYVQQSFNPISVSLLLSASFMAYRPEPSPMAIWWDYSDGTSGDTFFNQLSTGWNSIDILPELDSNLELVSVTFWGYSGADSAIDDITIFDAFSFCSSTENEPVCGDIFGCTDSGACNYNIEATIDDGECLYQDSSCVLIVDDYCSCCGGPCDGICPEELINSLYGENWFCFYDLSEPSYEEGQILIWGLVDENCECKLVIEGCVDLNACNYNATATEDDGSCEYPEFGYDCDGNCLEDLDNDGVCDSCETMDYLVDEGCNCDIAFESAAYYTDVDEVNCITTQACYCECINDLNNNGVCDETEGCMDETACNYNPDAIEDDDSCEYPDLGYDCNGNCLEDLDDDGLCDSACPFMIFETEDCDCVFDPVTYTVYYYDVDEVGCITYEMCYCECYNDSDEDGICDENENNTQIEELSNTKQRIKIIDILGRETTHKGFQLEVYNDGSVEKKYLIK